MGVLVVFLVVLPFICQCQSLESLRYNTKRYQENVWSDPSDCASRNKEPVVLTDFNNFSVDIRMPGVVPPESDTYLCMAVPVPTSRDAYVVDFLPHASMTTVHHMLLFGCQTPASSSSYWNCGGVRDTCKDEPSIMYAWARNAPPTKLPKDVGFKVGRNSGISYFVLQMHYGDVSSFRDHHRDCSGLSLRLTSKPQPLIAGIYLLMSMDTVILPGKKVTNADIACEYTSYPIYPFAFRTHTHQLGRVVSGYRIRDGRWSLIGRQSPLLPQAFYPANRDVSVKHGDIIAARCMFTGEGRTSKTYIGGTGNDEMCNFYLMYYMDSRHGVPYMQCTDTGLKQLFRNIPAEANIPVPVNPGHMHSMMHTAHTKDKGLMLETSKPQQLLDMAVDDHLEQVTLWPVTPLRLGQVSGLALDSEGNLVIFHRGDHRWGINSFDNLAAYQQRSLGPIQQSTILVVDPIKGHILKASGRNMFYLPHGITTDKDNNYWVTDVALHQVLKVTSDGRDGTLLALGQAFTPGSDQNHFCKPTDVAVDTVTGNIFISDGYCNARIVKYSAGGQYLSEWGAGSSDRRRRVPFKIPHSLVFLPDKQEICVADRENGRIQCFLAQTGEFVKEIKKEDFGGEVFAITYSSAEGGLIFAVNGESPDGPSAPLKGFVINYSSTDIMDTFSPEKPEFQMPHDIAVTKDGTVFVGDTGSNSVFKFNTEKAHRSVKKGGIEVQELEEMETIVQAKMRPEHLLDSGANQDKTQSHSQMQKTQQTQPKEENQKTATKQHQGQRVYPVVMTVLLLVPLVLVVSVGVFICWRRNGRHEVKADPSAVGGILGKLSGKAVGSLNLGNFFASHKGYSRQGFDQLSTEGSDQERNDEESTDSENEEYSAPPAAASSS